jgi:hypothetical protein
VSNRVVLQWQRVLCRVVFGVAIVWLSACRFGFAPERRDDATTIDDGDATVGDGATGDTLDAPFVCPAECNAGCAGNACRITGDALTAIVCPPGIPCVVTCSSFQACKADIMCGNASSCHVICNGENACYFGVECGPGPCTIDCIAAKACPAANNCYDSSACTINCTGTNSCKGSVDCASSCACDVTCAADAACPNPPGFVTCPTNCDDADGCDSSLQGCSTCQ